MFNQIAATVTATVLALGAFQVAFPDGASPSGSRVAGAWMLGAIVWAIVYGLLREGIRPTASVFRRH